LTLFFSFSCVLSSLTLFFSFSCVLSSLTLFFSFSCVLPSLTLFFSCRFLFWVSLTLFFSFQYSLSALSSFTILPVCAVFVYSTPCLRCLRLQYSLSALSSFTLFFSFPYSLSSPTLNVIQLPAFANYLLLPPMVVVDFVSPAHTPCLRLFFFSFRCCLSRPHSLSCIRLFSFSFRYFLSSFTLLLLSILSLRPHSLYIVSFTLLLFRCALFLLHSFMYLMPDFVYCSSPFPYSLFAHTPPPHSTLFLLLFSCTLLLFRCALFLLHSSLYLTYLRPDFVYCSSPFRYSLSSSPPHVSLLSHFVLYLLPVFPVFAHTPRAPLLPGLSTSPSDVPCLRPHSTCPAFLSSSCISLRYSLSWPTLDVPLSCLTSFASPSDLSISPTLHVSLPTFYVPRLILTALRLRRDSATRRSGAQPRVCRVLMPSSLQPPPTNTPP